MKIFILFVFVLVSSQIHAQEKICGNYHDYFGSELEINSDSTFKFIWIFDLQSSWTNGIWKTIDDTIYFTMIPVFDTIEYKDGKSNLIVDSLILSKDGKSKSFSKEYADTFLMYRAAYGQNNYPVPKKLYYRKDKLFGIYDNGKLRKKKVRGFSPKKKYPPWYIKKKDQNTFACNSVLLSKFQSIN